MVRSIVIKVDKTTRKKLLQSIERKKKRLITLTTQYEILRDELDVIKREYYFRVGKLFLRDNELDIEIIRYKNILALMKKGFSYSEAIKHLRNTFYGQKESQKKDQEYVRDHVEGIYNQFSEIESDDIKSLWKKAVTKFHPDLVVDPEEKKRREDIMKQINSAYAARDYAKLEELYHNNHLSLPEEVSVEDLEKLLIHLENMLIEYKNNIIMLKQSEWYGWKTKIRRSKKTGEDVFKELEDALLDDIVKKLRLLSALKKDVGEG